jgi:hypothetical protein
VYNLVDDDLSPQILWLPAFPKFVGAPEPPHMNDAEATASAGEDVMYHATKVTGSSNAKAKGSWVETPTVGVAGGVSG